MDLNEQVGGLIIDKRVQRDSRAEALLRHCCRTVTSVLLSLFCHSLLLYCAIELFARTDGRTGTRATMTSAPGFESQHINQHASGFARRDHRGHTHTHTTKNHVLLMRPAADATHMLPRHTQTWWRIQTPLASGQIVHLMTALPRPHKPRGTHMCTLTPTHL